MEAVQLSRVLSASHGLCGKWARAQTSGTLRSGAASWVYLLVRVCVYGDR